MKEILLKQDITYKFGSVRVVDKFYISKNRTKDKQYMKEF
jgi:hypothetical protein